MTRRAVMVAKRALHYSFLVAVCSVLSYSMIRNAVRREEAADPPPGKVVVVAKVYRVGYRGPAIINGMPVILELPDACIIVLRGRLGDGTMANVEQVVPPEVWHLAEEGQVLTVGGGGDDDDEPRADEP